MKHKDITQQIIGCAYQVYNKLGFGFLESIYKKAMMIELNKINLKVEQEKPLKVYYDNQEVSACKLSERYGKRNWSPNQLCSKRSRGKAQIPPGTCKKMNFSRCKRIDFTSFHQERK